MMSIQADVAEEFITLVSIEITRPDQKVLTEVNQTFHSHPSCSRMRLYQPADKVLPNETVDNAIKRILLSELGIHTDELNYHMTYDFEDKYVESNSILYSYRRYEVTIDESELRCKIKDGYQHTVYNDNGSKHVTTTWNWL